MAWSSTTSPRSPKPTGPAAAPFGCARAGTKEDTGRGGWVAVVTIEIPYGVQKSRLIEQYRQTFLNEKKIPLLADIRDELTRGRADRASSRAPARSSSETSMESLFRLTELEARVSVNMNVLVDGVTPRVVSLGEALKQWLDHRRNVLVRRSRHRLAAIENGSNCLPA